MARSSGGTMAVGTLVAVALGIIIGQTVGRMLGLGGVLSKVTG